MKWRPLGLVILVACSSSGGESPGGGTGSDSSSTDVSGAGSSDVGAGGPGADAASAVDAAPADSTSPGVDAPTGTCTDGALGCLNEANTAVCVSGAWQFNTKCGDDAFCLDGLCTKPATCTPGAVTGCDGLSYELVCLPDGRAVAATPCKGEQKCVAGKCADAACTPGVGQCTSSGTFRVCAADGSGFEAEQSCGPDTTCLGGKCMSLCEADIKYNTNVGCEYWSVDLDNDPTHHPAFPNNPTPEMFPHSVVISNPSSGDASVTFSVKVRCADGSACSPSKSTCGAVATVCEAPADAVYDLDIPDNVVPAGQSREFKMPVMNVSGSVVAPKAIRVVASRPVVAYQFNPFDSENAASNDGSLLLPRNGLGKLYYAVSLPSRAEIKDLFGNPWFPANNGFLAVVAPAGTTTVSVTPTVDVIANPAGGVPQDGTSPAVLAAGQTFTFTLEPYDVLNLEQLGKTEIITPGKIIEDLTGTRIEADKPVAVFSGHQVAGVQEALKLQITDVWDSCCTEHMEEQLMPVETWGTEALCVKSKPRGQEADRWVVVAGEDGVSLSTTPQVDGLHGKVLAKAGDRVRVETKESFVLSASGKIQVVQFLMSQGQTQPMNGGDLPTGDPSMILIPPSKQFRDGYVIRTADGFGTNWTTVIRPAGVPVVVDGAPIPDGAFSPLGDGSWQYAWREVTKGTHSLTSEEPFGLLVYGYGSVTAYGYPGGMNLEQ